MSSYGTQIADDVKEYARERNVKYIIFFSNFFI